MTSNKSWGVDAKGSRYCYVMLYVSRNKDNKEITNFKERRKAFICSEEKLGYYKKQFYNFADEGVVGEMSRLYISVNKRDMSIIRKQLIHFLIDEEDFNLCSMNSKLAAIAAQKECAAEKKWMIDFDSESPDQLHKMMDEIKALDDTIECHTEKTPHGYAIICNHGFDSREIMNRWSDVATIKKDDLLCANWITKEE